MGAGFTIGSRYPPAGPSGWSDAAGAPALLSLRRPSVSSWRSRWGSCCRISRCRCSRRSLPRSGSGASNSAGRRPSSSGLRRGNRAGRSQNLFGIRPSCQQMVEIMQATGVLHGRSPFAEAKSESLVFVRSLCRHHQAIDRSRQFDTVNPKSIFQ